MRLSRGLAGGLGVLVVTGSLLAVAPAQAEEQHDQACSDVAVDQADPTSVTSPSAPVEQVEIGAAHERARGRGVTVAVVDSGIAPAARGIAVAARHAVPGSAGEAYFHGTAVAGLIAGRGEAAGQPIGFAPAARIVDVQVYAQREDGPNPPSVPTANLVAGLRWLAANRAQLGLDIVNVSLSVQPSPGLRSAVADLVDHGVVVVAAAGNRVQGQSGPYTGGEDARDRVFPAGYPGVVVAGSASSDAQDFVLANSATDVAAPTRGAVSYALNGGTCLLPDPATSWASAEVSGVLALLRERFPRDDAAQLVARLVATADGRTDVPSTFTGAGVVQPLEALTRPLHPDAEGRLADLALPAADGRATPPAAQVDVLAETKHDAVWWGLLGGGALLLALVLRPVLAKRH